jgi:hypothetical protein
LGLRKPFAAPVIGIQTCANLTIRSCNITAITSTSALQIEGGHLSRGRGGFTLHFGRGARLSGYDCESFKACCIAARLPVIDSWMVTFEDVVRLAIRGPMVAVGEEEASLPPYHALSFAPLSVMAQAYRAAGAEVFNIPGLASPRPGE